MIIMYVRAGPWKSQLRFSKHLRQCLVISTNESNTAIRLHGLTHASRTGDGGTVRVWTSDTSDLEDSVDNTTDTLAGNETGSNGVA